MGEKQAIMVLRKKGKIDQNNCTTIVLGIGDESYYDKLLVRYSGCSWRVVFSLSVSVQT